METIYEIYILSKQKIGENVNCSYNDHKEELW